MLYIVATPIGNLDDFSARAIKTLRDVDFIIAENPSYSDRLLKHFEIPKKPVIQFADHNEERVLPGLLDKLEDQIGCLITDAGTPGISDPGFRLVRACVEKGIEVVSIPGATAAMTALAASGLPTDKFLFVGFLPKTEPKLFKAIDEAKLVDATLIAYESPERIIKTGERIAAAYPDAHLVIARELTKLHEEYIRGTSSAVADELKSRPSIKGEITLLISFK